MSYMQEFIKENELANKVWAKKYMAGFDQTINTMVKEVYSVLPYETKEEIESYLEANSLEEATKNIFFEGRGLPGGRVIFYFASKSLGQARNLTPMNCFVIPIKDDSMDAILTYNLDMGNTFKMGGGVGTTVSGLRPKDAPVNNAALTSTGPVSFLSIFNETAIRVGQNNRRGALMKAMSVYHPDILDFITIKQHEDLSAMNISVMVDSKFMEANDENGIELWYPTKINHEPQAYREIPYIADAYLYDDENFYIKSTGEYRKRFIYKRIRKSTIMDALVESTWKTGDPGLIFADRMQEDWGGEEPLHATNPCGEEPLVGNGSCNLGALNLAFYAYKTPQEFEKDVKILTVFLDTLQEYCIQNNLYPLQAQREQARRYRPIGLGPTGVADYFILKNTVYGSQESLDEFDKIMSIKRQAEVSMSAKLAEIYKQGVRNYQISTVAPTGSISMILGCSSGIEPNFDFTYEKLINGNYEEVSSDVKAKAKDEKVLVTAHDVSLEDRIAIQAVAQKYTDGSISSTLNLANSATKEQIRQAYELAWQNGLKGVTIYRDGSKTQGGLKLTKAEEKRDVLDGKTVKVPLESSWYITVNFRDNVPVELFINAGKSGSDTKAWTEGLGRAASLYLQEGGSATKLIDALSDIKGQQTIFKDGWTIQSGPDAIAQALSHVLAYSPKIKCPSCGEEAFIYVEGCGICKKCGFSKCG